MLVIKIIVDPFALALSVFTEYLGIDKLVEDTF